MWIRMHAFCLSGPVVGFLSPYLYSKQKMQSDKRKGKKNLIPPIHSSLSSQPPTFPSHLPFSHSDSYWNPSEVQPHPPYPLPLIAKLARTQWTGQERMSKWKWWKGRGREEQRDGDTEGEEEEEDSVLPNVPVMRILSERAGEESVCQSDMEVWKEWVFISETPCTPASFPPLSLCSSCLQDLWDCKPTVSHSSNSTSTHSQTHTPKQRQILWSHI